MEQAGAVVCGAGIVGVATAWHLAVRQGMRGVWLVDERAPLTLTSDKSTECYRNWWAGPDGAMVALMNRSIDLLEDLAESSGNAFHLNRRGYLYATADAAGASALAAEARRAEDQGAGTLRSHASAAGSDYAPAPAQGWQGQPTGADLLTDPALIRRHFPYLTERTQAVLHARRCGWFSGQQLGMLLLEQARAAGMRQVSARVEAVRTEGGRVAGVRLRAPGGATTDVATERFINCAGPYVPAVARLVDIELPVRCEPHLKIAFADVREAIPREAPMLIWIDPQRLDWGPMEHEGLREDPERRGLLDELPPGPHCRPEGGAGSRSVLALWSYALAQQDAPRYPLEVPAHYAEVVLRGLGAMVPALRGYLERLPRATVDGGFYAKTPENRPLCGPAGPAGAYVCGAASGFGLMSACALGELAAAHVTGGPLPNHAPAFLPSRYEDPAYRARLAEWTQTGQL